MKLLYFAWMREKIGTPQEDISLPAHVTTVQELVTHLSQQASTYADAFENKTLLRVAVNQVYVPLDAPVSDTDEIAFFPPVTGGSNRPRSHAALT